MLKHKAFLLWITVSVALTIWLGMHMLGENKTQFLPGQTSAGHYQFEIKCDSCHTKPFTSKDDMQQACMNCHGKELKAADDSHPKSKFTDPRNAAVLKKVEATYCVTCHKEHVPDQTRAMGLTLATDVCFNCHANIAEDRPSHRDFDFQSCASAGCHNFHDNRALYEDFLVKYGHEADLIPGGKTVRSDFAEYYKTIAKHPVTPLKARDAKQPGISEIAPKILHDWSETAHASSGVNCIQCHQAAEDKPWTDKPDHNRCKTCHQSETETFLAGKHGIRLGLGLPAMTPAEARLPMNPNNAHKSLNCMSCHSAHRFDTQEAAINSCLNCHADDHSKAYKSSPHFQTVLKAASGHAASETAVSCATCHLPRMQNDSGHVFVNHNQNDNLRPNEKMIRSVCMNCHGLAFSIDSLADPLLINNNFHGKPARHIESVDLSLKRVKK